MRTFLTGSRLAAAFTIGVTAHLTAAALRGVADLLDPASLLRAPDRFDVLDTDDTPPAELPTIIVPRPQVRMVGGDGACMPLHTLTLDDLREWGWVSAWVRPN